MKLVNCLELTDQYISTLATMMLGYGEFDYPGNVEKFSRILNSRWQTIFRLETCRLIYTRYRDPQPLKKEVVPNFIASENQHDTIFESDIQRTRFLSCIRELVYGISLHKARDRAGNGRFGGYKTLIGSDYGLLIGEQYLKNPAKDLFDDPIL